MAADDVRQLCGIELNELTQKLEKELKKDIVRIHTDSIYCDLELVLGKSTLYVNCCLLQVRAATFYTQLCSLQQKYSNGCELDVSTVKRIKSFVRDIYEQDDIRPAESLIVKHLKNIAISPDLDQYVTPLTSPSEIFAKESGFVLKPDSAYYSIVPLDWEKELAEQDFLIESFRSILRKEKSKSKSRPQNSSSCNFQNYRKQRDSRSLLDLKRAVEEDGLLLQEEGFLLKDLKNKPKLGVKRVKCSVIHLVNHKGIQSYDECGFFDAEDSSSPCNDSLVDMRRGVSDKSKMSSNMVLGPDSGLATSAEDIPLDQECGLEASKSISSSVSSDCCVWDSSATPQNTEVSSWVDSAPHHDDSGVNTDFVDRVLDELVGRSQITNQDHILSNVTECFRGFGAVNTPKHSYFIDASSLLDETEMHPHAAEAAQDSDKRPFRGITNSDVENNPGEILETRVIQEIQTIDEEAELKTLSRCEGKATASQSQEMILPEVSGVHGQNIDKSGSSHLAVKLDLNSRSHSTQECTGEEKPPSLIRSNTFELETEDDRLALLRQEYERRQGSLIFQRCMSQSSGPLSDGGSEDLNQHCTSLILPDSDSSLAIANLSLFPTHVVDEEIQTPDSLNNDLPETLSQEKSISAKAENLQILSPKRDKDLVDLMPEDAIVSLPPYPTSSTAHEVSSPLSSRRKTDSAPILSGAAPPLFPETKTCDKKVRSSNLGSISSAWVVDISDIAKSPEVRRRKGELSLVMSEDLTSEKKDEQTTSETKGSTSSLGFFIDLKDPQSSLDDKYDSIASSEGSKISRQSSDSGKVEKQNACEFFVDLKHPTDPQRHSPKPEVAQGSEKKLFSMFIDFGDKILPKAKPELSSRSKTPLSPFSCKKKNLVYDSVTLDGTNGKLTSTEVDQRENSMAPIGNFLLQPASTTLTNDQKKNSFFMFIDSESAPANQKGPSSCRTAVNQNCKNGKEKVTSRIQHVRANSTSSVKKLMYSNPNTSTLSSSSRHLSSQSLQNAETYSDNEDLAVKPMFSSFHASLPLEESHGGKVDRSQEEIVECSELSSHVTTGSNESSACSLETYSVHTPEQSSATDDYSSEKKDSFHNYHIVKEEVVIDAPSGENKHQHQSSEDDKHLLRGVLSKSESKLKLEAKVNKSFVRLSDLDKEPISVMDRTTPSVAHRMSRSIPETSWIESKLLMSHSTGGGSGAMSRSSRSLSRLFPHLSMYSGSIGRSKTSSICSPLTEDLDTMRSSQVSDISSMQSSAGLEYSTESTDISSDRGSPATQLGDDLLKMFLEEINTDVIVEVGGRRIKAHKCILSSRCQYFAAILSGGWVESAGNVISLQGFSYTVVQFALCHIYSGASTIPDQISIVELASLADMLSLEGLKDVIMYTLKVKYCHFFHKPCAVCSVGVLECLPLAAAYGLDDIYRKSLRWITKYFVRIWPTKTFTALPRELIEKCYQQHVIHMTADNVLETILCCDKLLSTIPTVRWAEPVFVLTSRLIETCIKFMSDNFCSVLASENFISMGREVPWNVSRFQESLVSACERLPPDQSCRSYTQLHSVLEVVQGPNPPSEMAWHPNFVELLVQLYDLCERTLIKQAARAARTPGWGQMPTELRRKVQDAACLVLAPADHASSRYRRSASDGLRQSNQRSSYSRNLDLHQVKMAMVQHARKSNSNDHSHTASSVVVRQKIPSERSNTVSRRSAPVAHNKPAEKSASIPSQGRPKTWPAQVKSRYLEKRPNHCNQVIDLQEQKKQLDAPVPQRRVAAPVKGMFISSSDSSRNSSPAMKRSSNMTSSNSKVLDSSSRTRAATVTVCNSSSSHLNASANLKEEGFSKSTDNIARRSLPVHVKSQSAANSLKTPPTARKKKDSLSPDRTSQEFPTKQDGTSSQTPSTLGTQSQSITMSNDSLATVSSCDDIHLIHSEKNVQTKTSTESKTNTSRHTTGSHLNSNVTKQADVSLPRTPLSLTNKKAPPSNALRKTPLSTSKPADNNTITASGTPLSLLSRRSISHNAKSPILSSSRLAIPLRTSRSVSSVPDKRNIRTNSSSEVLPSKRQAAKDQSRSNYSASSRRVGTGSSVVSSSLAGKVLPSKGKKISVSEIKSSNYKKTDKVNGDCSLESTVHPTVGPRSGTFLKDEPTILKTPVVENN